MRQRFAALALLSVLFAPRETFAQQGAAVFGQVFDRSGAPVADATVRINGGGLAAPRTTTTSENGLYTFNDLAPGVYTVEVEKAEVGKMATTVKLTADHDARTDFILGAQLAERIAVSGSTPEVDLRTTEIAFNFKRDFIQDLPLERSYMGLLQLIPGIAENGTFAPNGGGSRQDNTYLLDGANITNPLFGYLSTEVNELDIAELHVKRGAVSAEFGRSQGFITDIVTKSGTNRLSGTYRFEAIPHAWIQNSRKQVRSSTDRWVNAVGVGGPVVKNRLFFYGSGRVFRAGASRSANLFGPLPDRKDRTDEYFGKATASPMNSAFLSVGYRQRPSETEFGDIGPEDAPSVGTNSTGTNRIFSVNYDWLLNSRTTLTVRYVHMDEQTETVALTDLGFQPPFNVFGLATMGRVRVGGLFVGGTDRRLNRQNYDADELKASVSHVFDLGKTSHELKVGFGWTQGDEDLTRKSNGWGDISSLIISFGGQPREVVRALYYPEQPPQLSRGRTDAIFVQDNVALTPRLTVNAGVLFNRDQFIQERPKAEPATPVPSFNPGTFLSFGFGRQVQPRLGVNYQLRPDQGDKIYANWGRYYGLDQKSGARSMASVRLYQEFADFDVLTGTLLVKGVAENTASKTINSAARPPYMDEVVVGYAAPLPDGWSLDAFFMYRDSDNFIEDIPTVLPDSAFVYANDPVAERRYKTFVVELNRAVRDRWAMNVSYAWSKLYGNFDLDYDLSTQVFNTSSLINDGPGAFTGDTFRQGVLSQDRPHVLKMLGTWWPQQINDLSLGMYVRVQSGTPWEARGLSWPSSVQLLRLLEPAGSHRNPIWMNVDMLLKYGVRLDARRTIRLEGRLLNVFNQETVLSVNTRKYENIRNNTTIPNPPPASCLSCWTDAYSARQLTNQPSATFGQPTAFAQQRRFLLSVLFDF